MSSQGELKSQKDCAIAVPFLKEHSEKDMVYFFSAQLIFISEMEDESRIERN